MCFEKIKILLTGIRDKIIHGFNKNKDIFTGIKIGLTPVAAEKWIEIEGGAAILLKVECGGQISAPLVCKRKSLFKSWSFYKISK